MKLGKITCTNKQLESHDIPDRFFKRMEVCIFGEIDNGMISIPYEYVQQIYGFILLLKTYKICSCHNFFYICGDIEDDEYPYAIPKDWIKLIDDEKEH